MVDPWEAMQQEYIPTALVLDHIDREVNTVLGGAVQPDGSTRKIQIILLAGAGEAQYSLFWTGKA
jgi:nicotinamide mononucleotide adenylyltransferase